ncbi:energy transducer TonB [Gynurincola endophyticus]|uniref:energy transducer TonB n=1 Tax=Gynurincola endophyticus TaxID=2479004 RepID=UPI000F8E04E1|nr:energy transducer TonB [Gynurincola endophyticus]
MNRGSHEKFSILEFLFQNRNKAYGAYELRTHYSTRMYYAVSGALAAALIFTAVTWLPAKSGNINPQLDFPVTQLREVDLNQKEPPEVKVEPPRQSPPPEQIRTVRNTTPIIVQGEVPENEAPPPVDVIDMAAIATYTQEGIDTHMPAVVEEAKSSGVIEGPKATEEPDGGYFIKVEKESQFPPNSQAWIRYLQRTMRYPPEAMDNEIQGVVVVEFKVDEEGNVKDVKAISGPVELYEEAERVIRKSGQWTPAIQNGRKVKSIKKQPIKFTIS